jgi:parallel beta-helix repeat protein
VISEEEPVRRYTKPIVAALALGSAALLLAGPLDPPSGPVAPTYKTLAEVEPRTAISAANTPGDADSLYRITQRGAYYLSGNITGVSGKHGIEIAADGVTIDLMGFSMFGGEGSLDGIATSGLHGMITIRDGVIGGWGEDGIDLTEGGTGESSLIEGILASGNMDHGIRAANLAVVRGCEALNTLGSGLYAIRVGTHSMIEGCSVRNNNGGGIFADTECTISDCVASFNVSSGIVADSRASITACTSNNSVFGAGFAVGNSSTLTDCTADANAEEGFSVGDGCTLLNCVATENLGLAGIQVRTGGSTVTGCTAAGNTAHGIWGGVGSTVSGCTTKGNGADGIVAYSQCLVVGNTCHANGLGASTGAGIHAFSTDNRIEGNNCTSADRGIQIDGAGNFVARNTCSGNSLNWVVAAANVCFVVQASAGGAINGSSGGVPPGSTDPNANFSY